MTNVYEQLGQRMVVHSDLFCGQCGYNLRTLSVLGRCPECGNEYDARPTRMKGLLLGEDVGFPFEDALGVFLCGLIIAPLVLRGVKSSNEGWFLAAGPFLLILLAFLINVIRKLHRLITYRVLVRSARQQTMRRAGLTSTPRRSAADYPLPCDTLCGKCEFNLVKLPVCDRCPKCGNEYDARPHVWRGVFTPGLVQFPLPGVVTTIGCAVLGAFFLADGITRNEWWRLLPGFLLLAGAMVMGGRTFLLLSRFVRHGARTADAELPSDS